MATIRCPHCGSSVMIRGSRWECGYCGDFGSISSLHPSEKAELMQAFTPSVQVTITVTDTSDNQEAPPRRFSRSELEDMVRRWDLSENGQACRDLLIAAFPEAASCWPAEELSEMDISEFLVETAEHDPETAIQMMKLLLDTAESHLQDPEVAEFLLGNELYDLCLGDALLQEFQLAFHGEEVHQKAVLHRLGQLVAVGGHAALQFKDLVGVLVDLVLGGGGEAHQGGVEVVENIQILVVDGAVGLVADDQVEVAHGE